MITYITKVASTKLLKYPKIVYNILGLTNVRYLASGTAENMKTGRGATRLRMVMRMLQTLNTRSETSMVKLRKRSNEFTEAVVFDVYYLFGKYPKSCSLPHGSIPMSPTAGLVG